MRALDDAVYSNKVYYAVISDTSAWVVSRSNTIAEFRGWRYILKTTLKKKNFFQRNICQLLSGFLVHTLPLIHDMIY
ncbi:hypothetical protein G9A89_014349 [Geosiphon pyriformis]|nr:hypothetical protein G9A89_014349 [Geosiphon pyriformis]